MIHAAILAFAILAPGQPAIPAKIGDYDVRLAEGTWRAQVFVTIRVSKEGIASVEIDKTQPLIVIAGPGFTPPTDQPDPDPPQGDFKTQLQEATDAVESANKANEMQALAKLYESTGTLPVKTTAQLQQATNIMFAALDIPAWTNWKNRVDALVAQYSDDLEAMKAAWQMIAEVLRDG